MVAICSNISCPRTPCDRSYDCGLSTASRLKRARHPHHAHSGLMPAQQDWVGGWANLGFIGSLGQWRVALHTGRLKQDRVHDIHPLSVQMSIRPMAVTPGVGCWNVIGLSDLVTEQIGGRLIDDLEQLNQDSNRSHDAIQQSYMAVKPRISKVWLTWSSARVGVVPNRPISTCAQTIHE